MGLTNAKIQLRNPRLPDLEPVEIDALADTGAVHFCIPPHLQIQLELEEIDKKEITYHPHSGWFEVAPRGGREAVKAPSGPMKPPSCFVTLVFVVVVVVVVVVIGATKNAQDKTMLSKRACEAARCERAPSLKKLDYDHDYDNDNENIPCSRKRQSLFGSHRQSRWLTVWSNHGRRKPKARPYVGPIERRFKNRIGFAGALVMGDQALLGAIPMKDMDLVVVPKTREVIVNPSSPNIASSIAKLGAPCARGAVMLRTCLATVVPSLPEEPFASPSPPTGDGSY